MTAGPEDLPTVPRTQSLVVLATIAVPAAIFDDRGIFQDGNPAFHELVRVTAPSQRINHLRDLVGEDGSALADTLAARAEGGSIPLPPTRNRLCHEPTGRLVTVVPLRDGHLDRILAVVQAEPAKPSDGDGELLLGRDLTTGLPDAFLFRDRLTQALLMARREHAALAVMTLSIDGVTSGIGALDPGWIDQVAPAIAQHLVSGVRASDTVARLEGQTFGILTPVRSPQHSIIVARRIVAATRQPLVIDGRPLGVTASLGVSLYPGDATDAGALIQASRDAQRRAGGESGERCRFANPLMTADMQRQSDLEVALRGALENDHFLVHYQPKIDALENRIIGMEALIRWADPAQGLVPPGAFIPAAEEIGLIGDIGDWVLNRACADTAAWRQAGLEHLQVAVNVSASQFRSPRFLTRLQDALSASGLPAERLELELTETTLMTDLDAAVASMAEIRKMGVRLAIDDFGTGYSSLSHLSRFPITTVKIDRSFVQRAEQDRKTAEIIRAIIGLSRGLDLSVVGEGAETRSQVDFLTRHHCSIVQGFYFSRPLPAGEFESLAHQGLDRSEPDK